jgi:branched-subunit amino acid transport protein
MNVWAVMLLGGALTFAMRLSFIWLFGRFEIPEAAKRALKYVPPAVLSALVAPALFMPEGALDLSFHNFRLIAGLVAILVAGRTKHALGTIAAGMGALLIWMWISGAVAP